MTGKGLHINLMAFTQPLLQTNSKHTHKNSHLLSSSINPSLCNKAKPFYPASLAKEMKKVFSPVVSLFLLTSAVICSAIVEDSANCAAVGTLISPCTEFVNYARPDPIPGSSCCDAMTLIGTYSDSSEKRRWLCNCFIDLINVYSSNATAISTLSGFCGVVLGFTIDPNTDCNFIQ